MFIYNIFIFYNFIKIIFFHLISNSLFNNRWNDVNPLFLLKMGNLIINNYGNPPFFNKEIITLILEIMETHNFVINFFH